MHPEIDPQEFRDRLSGARAQAVQRYERAREEAYSGAGVDTGDEADEAQRDTSATLYSAQADREYERIEAIEDAMARLDEGTYGECKSCGEPIEIGRLRALPATTLCAGCAALLAREREHRQDLGL
jgi:RNA polymerase-binding protein DksA